MEPYTVRYLGSEDVSIFKWKVKCGSKVNRETLLCSGRGVSTRKAYKLTSDCSGTIKTICANEGDVVHPGDTIAQVELCNHPTVWRNMCAECGTYLKEKEKFSASVAMEHTIPDLLISETEAQFLGREDENRLLKSRQLVLLVDLDQTLIHTTNDNIPNNLKDVYHFQLPHGQPRDLRWYHTKFRPRTEQFLEDMSKLFELHICTFGVRSYAHTIARFLDPDGKYFQQRILSRDECFHPTLKTSNLKALFPNGDSMVCIIDDRQDVWRNAPNLVHVKPYRFFDGTADINAPPEADKTTADGSLGDAPVNCSRRQAKIIKIRQKKENANARQLRKNPQDVEDRRSADESAKAEVLTQGENDEGKKESEPLNGDTTTEENSELESSEKDREDDAPSAVNTDLSEAEGHSTTEADVGDDEEEVELIEWEDLDDYLIYLEDILRRIHAAFYEMYDEMKQNANAPTPDLKKIVPYVRKKILRGANIMFSGVFPTNHAPETTQAYQLAQALGANVHLNFVPPGTNGTNKDTKDNGDTKETSVAKDVSATTHLVAARLGTEKVRNISRYRNVNIVNPDWLWTCADRWEWVDERLFPLNEDTSKCFLYRDSPEPNTGQRPYPENPPSNRLSTDRASLCMTSVVYEEMLKEVDENLAESDTDSEEEMKETENETEEENKGTEKDESSKDEENDGHSETESQMDERLLRNKVLQKRKWDESSSEIDSLSGDCPKGWKQKGSASKRMKTDDLDPDDNDVSDGSDDQNDNNEDSGSSSTEKDGSDSDNSFGSVDEMVNILERDYLS